MAAYPSAALPRDLAEGCRSQAREQEARNQRLSELTAAARRAIDAGDFAVAIERCEEALELWPHHELAATLLTQAQEAIAREARRQESRFSV